MTASPEIPTHHSRLEKLVGGIDVRVVHDALVDIMVLGAERPDCSFSVRRYDLDPAAAKRELF